MIYIFSKDTKNYIYIDFTKLKLFVSYDYLILVNHLRNKYLSKYCKISLLYLYNKIYNKNILCVDICQKYEELHILCKVEVIHILFNTR